MTATQAPPTTDANALSMRGLIDQVGLQEPLTKSGHLEALRPRLALSHELLITT
jgi:hypothetical protein